MASGNATVPYICKAQDSSCHSSVSSRLALNPSQGRMHGFLSKNPKGALLFWTMRTTVTVLVCVCVYTCIGSGVFFFYPAFFLLEFFHVCLSTQQGCTESLLCSGLSDREVEGINLVWILHEGGDSLGSTDPVNPRG